MICLVYSSMAFSQQLGMLMMCPFRLLQQPYQNHPRTVSSYSGNIPRNHIVEIQYIDNFKIYQGSIGFDLILRKMLFCRIFCSLRSKECFTPGATTTIYNQKPKI